MTAATTRRQSRSYSEDSEPPPTLPYTPDRRGVWVLDEDGPAGMAVVVDLQRKHGDLPKTVSAITGRAEGGRHRYFRYPADGEIRSQNKITLNGYGKVDLDVRGTGGYVIVPPSRHVSGKAYTWEHSPDDTLIAEAPAWLLALVTSGKPVVSAPAEGGSLKFTVGGGFVEDLGMAMGATVGQRHSTALRLIGGAIGRGLDLVLVAQQACEWARRCSPPMDETEVLRLVSDLSRKQAAQPKPATAVLPKPIPAPPPAWKPFPVEALPQPVRKYVKRSAAAIGCDPGYIATAILPTLAGAIGNSRQIILKRGWVEPAVLWGVLVGDSGTQKSPAIDSATQHVRKRQATAIELHRQAMEEYEKDLAQYKLDLESWKRSGRQKGEPQPIEPIKPICERFSCSDVTVEGLAVLLADAWRGLLLIRDEASGWIGGFDQYKSGHGADVAHWLTIYGARDLLVDRKGGERRTIFVRRAAVSVACGIQPRTLHRALGEKHFENGLAARLLLAMPPRRSKKWAETEVDEHLDRQIGDLFNRLYQLEPGGDDDDQPTPITLGLSSAGKKAWITFYNEHAERQANASGEEAAALSKIEGVAARLALVSHCVREAAGDQTVSGQVDDQDVGSGVAIAQWYAGEADRVYQILRETDEDRLRRHIAELIERKDGSITARQLRQCMRQFRDSTEAALETLAKAGVGSWETTGPADDGGRPTRVFRLSTVSTSTKPIANTVETGGFVDVDSVDTPQGDGMEVTYL